MRDHTGYYRTTSAPTPPSDAGTSERETCDDCNNLRAPLCLAHGCIIAAPAAEGPRAKPGPGERGYIGCPFCPDSGCLGREHHPMLPAAALPGAEAGTPEGSLTLPYDQLENAYHAQVAHTDFVRAEYQKRVAALTSEVRALREDKARLDWMQEHAAEAFPVFDMDPEAEIGYRVKSEETLDAGEGAQLRDAIDAARLASPSPTGAE